MHVYEALAESFMAEDVKDVFALLGDGNMHWSNAMAKKGANFIYTRHEHCAVSMAMSYARANNTIGIATVTCGPGLTQTMTAITTAVKAKIPLVIFAGESPISKDWYNQVLDQEPFVKACGADYFSIRHPKRIFTTVREVFFKAKHTSQPIVVGVPIDFQESKYEGIDKAKPSKLLGWEIQKPEPDTDYINKAINLILNSKKPILLAGLGAIKSDAKKECIEFADKIRALLATTLPARGFFYDHPFSINLAGGFSSDITRDYFNNADLVISAGSSLASHASDAGKLYPQAKVIQIDLDPKPINQGRVSSHLWIQADVKKTFKKINFELKNFEDKIITDSKWRDEKRINQIKTNLPDAKEFKVKEGYLDPRLVVRELDRVIPKDFFMVNSSGHCSYYPAHMLGRSHENFLTIREFGAIGNGLSYSIGAAVAKKNKRVALIDGDGGFYMHIQELETVVRNKLKMLFIVLNDEAYGSEIHKLRHDGLSDEGAVFGKSNLENIGQGFGLQSKKITKLPDIKTAFDEFEKSEKSAIWDIPISDNILSPVMRRLLESKKN